MSSIKRRPDGVYRARYRDDAGKEHSKHFPRKVDARRWLNEVTAAVLTGRYVDPQAGKTTLGTFYKVWADRQVWVPGTRRTMDRAVTDTGLADVALSALRASHGEQWVKRQSDRGLSPVTISGRMGSVRAVLAGAVRDKLLVEDPFAEVALPRKRKADAAMRCPTSAEVRTLIEAASPEFALVITLGAFAGLRAGEIAGLQVGDVDFLRRQVHIRRQITPDGEQPPKYGSERTVFVPEALTTLMSQQVAGTAGWLFVNKSDEPLDQNVLSLRWVRLRNKVKLPGLRLHDLRHYFASGLIAAGCDVVTVSRALGHSNPTVTLAVYSHLWPTAEDRTRRAASSMLDSVLGDSADRVRTGGGG